MNGTNVNITKKMLPLAAVIILCAACLVTVAYAYNATYKDTVAGSDVPTEEKSKYIYITGDGLGYPTKQDYKVNVDVQYDTVTEAGVTKATPKSYEITGITSLNGNKYVGYEDGVATFEIGKITINNKNTDLQNVFVTVSDVKCSEIEKGDVSLLKSDVTASNIFMKVDGANDYNTVFKLTQDKVEVTVYLVAEVNTTPDVLGVNPSSVEINDQGVLANTVESILAVPGFSISFNATAGDNLTIVSGTMTASDIASIKDAAATKPNLSVKVVNESGASIVMDSAAIATLGADAADLEITALKTPVSDIGYDISFGANHFGNGNVTISIPFDGEPNKTYKVAYLTNNVDELYDAVYADGFLTFTTNHLSIYAVVEGDDLAKDMPVKLEKDGSTAYYRYLGDAIKAGREGTSTITLEGDVTENKLYALRNTTVMTLDLNGKTLTAPNGLFYTKGVAADLTIDGSKEGSMIDSQGTVVYNETSKTTQDFKLTVNGGTYTGDYAFVLYEADSASFKDVTIKSTVASIWCGNAGVKNLVLDNVTTSSSSGSDLYLGTVANATLKNVVSSSAQGTALEIKSGNVKILGGSFTGAKYDVSEKIINHNGSGGAVAAIVINNAYCNDAKVDGVNVTIDNATVSYSDKTVTNKAIIIYTDVDTVAAGKDISFTWTDHSSDVDAFYNGTGSSIFVNGEKVATQ